MTSALIPILSCVAVLICCSCSQPLDIDTPRNKIYEDSIQSTSSPTGPIPAQLVSLSITENSQQWNHTFLVPTQIEVDTTAGESRLTIRTLGCSGSAGVGSRLLEMALRCESIPLDGVSVALSGDPADASTENGARFVLLVPGVGGAADSDVTRVADAVNVTTAAATIDPSSGTINCTLNGTMMYSGVVVRVHGELVVRY